MPARSTRSCLGLADVRGVPGRLDMGLLVAEVGSEMLLVMMEARGWRRVTRSSSNMMYGLAPAATCSNEIGGGYSSEYAAGSAALLPLPLLLFDFTPVEVAGFGGKGGYDIRTGGWVQTSVALVRYVYDTTTIIKICTFEE